MTSEQTPPRKFFRSRADVKISGVCGGIAEYFDLDPALVRVGWVVLTVFTAGFPGVIGYLIIALVVPQRPE